MLCSITPLACKRGGDTSLAKRQVVRFGQTTTESVVLSHATKEPMNARGVDRRSLCADKPVLACRAATNSPSKLDGGAEVNDGEVSEVDERSSDDAFAPLDPPSLFPSKHFPRLTLALVLYFPFGCLLGVFRILLWVALLAVDLPFLSNNNFMIKVIQSILGMNVKWQNIELIPKTRYAMVSNHQTPGDLMCLYRLPHQIIHLISSAIPKAATKVRNHRLKLWHASPEIYNELCDPGQKEPIHLFPEGGMTNGLAMMRFSRGFMRFAKRLPVVPMALRVSHPFPYVNTHTLASPFLMNLFMLCFLPWVNLEATVLPPMKKGPQELNAEFVERVQHRIAEELHIPIVDLNIKGKRAMVEASRTGS